jgi:plastocyanin domain-containing protein
MRKSIALVALSVLSIGAVGFLFSKTEKGTITSNVQNQSRNVNEKDGIQYIHINARGGYMPKMSIAKAGIPTKLIVKTENTYDCSAALVIRSINYQKILSPTGEEIVDLGSPKAGRLNGTCGMGMYSFGIEFK